MPPAPLNADGEEESKRAIVKRTDKLGRARWSPEEKNQYLQLVKQYGND
jgi:hypothetical protein